MTCRSTVANTAPGSTWRVVSSVLGSVRYTISRNTNVVTVLTGVPRKRLAGGQITLPAGRSLLVVARGQGAGPYTLALVGAAGGG